MAAEEPPPPVRIGWSIPASIVYRQVELLGAARRPETDSKLATLSPEEDAHAATFRQHTTGDASLY